MCPHGSGLQNAESRSRSRLLIEVITDTKAVKTNHRAEGSLPFTAG